MTLAATRTLIFLVFLTGCVQKDAFKLPTWEVYPTYRSSPTKPANTSTATITPTSTETPFPILPSTQTPISLINFPFGVNPLTGLTADNPSFLERRPIMVKVSNWPRSGRPHAGLSSADIIFEYYIGYQMNRFLAVYYGTDETNIGPVRSGRMVDGKLAQLYQGILAYGDADPIVDKILVEILGDRALSFGFIPCPAMCGEATHDATGVFANSFELSKFVTESGIDNSKPDLRGMSFSKKIENWDDEAKVFSYLYADFSVMQWHYSEETGLYELWQDFETDEKKIILAPTVDRNTNQPISMANILILFTNYIEYSPSLHDIDLYIGNEPQAAILFRDGKLTYGFWIAPSETSPLMFLDKNQNLLALKPGKSWIILAGNQTRTERVNQNEWDFYFDLP